MIASCPKLAALCFLLTASIASAQDCGSVSFDGCQGGQHALPSGTPSNKYAHGGCYTCSDGFPCHPVCNPAPTDEAPAEFLAYQRAMKAAVRGDLDAMIQIGLRIPNGRIVYNASRQSVQYLNCNRSAVIASFGIRNAFQELMVAKLTRIEAAQLAHSGWPVWALGGGGG